MIKVKLNVTKLDKTAFFKGQKGTYVDLVLWECKGGQDQFGNDFTVKQDMGKDRRGEKTPIVGSARFAGTSQGHDRTFAPPPPPGLPIAEWGEAKFTPGGGHAPEHAAIEDKEVPF